MTTSTTTPKLFSFVPSFSIRQPHTNRVRGLLELDDGSIVSCSADNTAKRWLLRGSNGKVLLENGTYLGHRDWVECAIQIDDNTILTGSHDRTVKVWNTTTCECLNTLNANVFCLLKKKNNSSFICGLGDDVRRISDLSHISSFTVHFEIIYCLCELEDGSLVTGSDNNWRRWDERGTRLQTFTGHSDRISGVICLERDVFLSSSYDGRVKLQ